MCHFDRLVHSGGIMISRNLANLQLISKFSLTIINKTIILVKIHKTLSLSAETMSASNIAMKHKPEGKLFLFFHFRIRYDSFRALRRKPPTRSTDNLRSMWGRCGTTQLHIEECGRKKGIHLSSSGTQTANEKSLSNLLPRSTLLNNNLIYISI